MMNSQNTNTPLSRLARLVLAAADAGILKRATLSKSYDKSILRATLTPKIIAKKPCLQLELMCYAEIADMVDKRSSPQLAKHENIFFDGGELERLSKIFEGFAEVNVRTTGSADCKYMASKSGRQTLIGEGKMLAAIDSAKSAPAAQKLPIIGNDRRKNYILSGDEEFLKLLGISDKNGRIHDKKQAKFRQINRFLEIVRDTEEALPKDAEHELHICDLCCGKSYLSFAVYYYFTAIRGRKVLMTGVDMKADVIDECNRIARELKMDGLTFTTADITLYTFGDTLSCVKPYVDMVVSLHACDTATDMVLSKASEWDAKVILSTPCCHHELNKKINSPELSFITKHSMLRQKLCDAATDALRLSLLESRGYEVAALELIDPEETPKNILLKGIKKRSADASVSKKALENYNAAKAFLIQNK